MARLSLSGIRKSYGGQEVLHGIDLSVDSGDFVVFVGPSGCGKSTLLRMMAGLEEITSGTFSIDGHPANNVSPSQRGIAMVFQSYALYPHMSVRENMGFGLRMARKPKAEREARVQKAASMLQLTDYLDRLPRELSGGQRQRVAIGRAITRDPKVFLFDEPLSNLDAALRVATRIEIAKLKESMPDTTMVYVTHDQVEAMTLADRIVVMNQGRIEQVGSPIELYETPANLFVARFIGSPAMNIAGARVKTSGSNAVIVAPSGNTVATRATIADGSSGQAVTIGVRPEDLTIVDGDDGLFEGSLTLVEQLGEATIAYVDVGGAEPLIAKLPGIVDLDRSKPVKLGAKPDRVHVFDENGNAFERVLDQQVHSNEAANGNV